MDKKKKFGESNLGIVIIGRNEGDRLKRCINSVIKKSDKIVYVDSGSNDGSVDFAISKNLNVIPLDISVPFSAARARNAGFEFLNNKYDIEFLQFIDGDCELIENWLKSALDFLKDNSVYAIAAGRRIERYPDKSIYNKLCDIEWNTPVGEVETIGGDFLVRVDAFHAVNGFNQEIVAGEEPDLCYRLRKEGWKIRRLDVEMTLHDANMMKFWQWWNRSKRTGHSYVQGFVLHYKDGKKYYFRATINSWVWAVIIPLIIVISSILFRPIYLLMFIIFPLQVVRIGLKEQKRIQGIGMAVIYGFFTMLAKLPQIFGQLLYFRKKIFKKNLSIIEYN